MKKTNRAADTRLPAYTPAEQAEIDATEATRIEMMYDSTARFFLGCEHEDAEGEAY
jgi:hypothetical protein